MAHEEPARSRNISLSPRKKAKDIISVLDVHGVDIKGLVEAVLPGHCLVRTHSSSEEFLGETGAGDSSSCLLLGEHLPEGKTAIEVMSELYRRNRMIPTLVIADRCSLRQVVATMRAGAEGFLTKPLDPAELLDDLLHALSKADAHHQRSSANLDARARVASLNSREVDVVKLVARGLLNKEAADLLGLALITVKVYRSRAMKKLGARNPVEMYQVALAGGLAFGPPKADGSSGNSNYAPLPIIADS